MKLCHMTGNKGNIITYMQHLGGHRPLKIWEGKRTSKIRRDFWQLSTLTANISRTCQDDDKGTQSLSRAISAALNQKNWWTLVH